MVVSPSADSVTIGGSVTLTAVPMDNGGEELTDRTVFWASENAEVAVVSEDGAVTGIEPGTVRIAASVEGVPGFSTITVLPKVAASITLSSNSLALRVGQESQLTATVRDSAGGVLGGADITWTSSNGDAASVSSAGLVHGAAPGSATITATSGTVSANATVTVTPVPANAVIVSPGEATRFVGETVQLTAQVTDADGSPLGGRPITWKTSAAATATVSQSGLVTAKAPGSATITATSEGKSGKSTITVKRLPVSSVDMDPGDLKLETGETARIEATPRSAAGDALQGRSIQWSSSATGVATVNQSGLVTARSPGSALIRARSEGVTGTTLVTVSTVPVASVEVTPATATVFVGKALQLDATTLDAEGNTLAGRDVDWSSDNDDIASVSSNGKVLALAAGAATITATSEGKKGTAKITVVVAVNAVTVEPDSTSVVIGNTVTLVATVRDADGNAIDGRDVAWSSRNTSVATVNGSGVVTGVAAGTATIDAESEGKTGSAKVVVTPVPAAAVEVTPNPSSVQEGKTVQLGAIPTDAGGDVLFDRAFTWSSSDGAVATVSESGLVTGVGVGTATITAATFGASGTSTLTVTSAQEGNIIITPAELTLSVTQSADLKGSVIGSDGQPVEDHSLSWSSNAPLVAAVNGNGHVTAIFPGEATITASKNAGSGNEKKATVTVTVVLPGTP